MNSSPPTYNILELFTNNLSAYEEISQRCSSCHRRLYVACLSLAKRPLSKMASFFLTTHISNRADISLITHCTYTFTMNCDDDKLNKLFVPIPEAEVVNHQIKVSIAR